MVSASSAVDGASEDAKSRVERSSPAAEYTDSSLSVSLDIGVPVAGSGSLSTPPHFRKLYATIIGKE